MGDAALKMLHIAAITALSTSLILTGTPAIADDPPADITPPVIYSTGLSVGQPFGRFTTFTPSFSDDVIAVQTLVNGRAYAYGGVKVRWPVKANLAGVGDDTDVDITVRVYDQARNYSELTTPVHTEFIAPEASFSPAGNTVVHGITKITGTAMSDDVAEIAITRGGEKISRVTAAPWELAWDTTKAGSYGQLSLEVTDRVGNVTIYRRYYTVDNAGPKFSFFWDPPNVVPAGEFSLSPWISEQSGVDRVEWWIDGVLRSTGKNNFRYDFGGSSRTTMLGIRAWDVNGYASTADYTLTVDADAPKVVSAAPAHGTLVRGTSVAASLRLSDVSRVDYVTPVSGYSGTDHTSPYTGKFKLGKDGKLTLKWWVTDYWGQGKYVYQTVVVDNTRPKLVVTKGPKNGAKVKSTVTVAAAASDKNRIAKVQLLINGKVVATDSTAAYKFTINTRKYGKKFTVKLRAYDKAGNATTTTTRTWHR